MSDWSQVAKYSREARVNGDAVIARAIARGVSPELVIEAFRRAHSLTREYEEVGELPPFELFEALPPGAIDLRIFDQEVWWVDLLRTPYRIYIPQSFTNDHLVNVIHFLTQWSAEFHDAYQITFPTRTIPEGPKEWLESTVLVRALREVASMRRI
jgi:hypothetical protein